MYKVGDHEFPSKHAFTTYCRDLLSQLPYREPIQGNYEKFVRAIFDLHPEKSEKLAGRSVSHFLRKANRGDGWMTYSLAVVRDDGTEVPFSVGTIARALKPH